MAEVLNHFGSGNLASAADLLAQRFKAVEQRALGRRETAVGLELVDATGRASRRRGSCGSRLATSRLRFIFARGWRRSVVAHDGEGGRTRTETGPPEPLRVASLLKILHRAQGTTTRAWC